MLNNCFEIFIKFAPMTQSNDEINLLDLFRKMGSFIKNSILWIVSSFLKNILIIISVSALGFLCGIMHYYFSKPVYSSDLILSSNYLPNDMCSEIIENLQWYVVDNTPEILAKKLNISENDAREIKKLEFSNFNEKLAKKYEDTILIDAPFRIHVLAGDYKIFEALQPALISYFEKNPDVVLQKNIHQTNTKLMIKKIEKQIIELDSLTKTISGNLVPRGTQTGFVFGEPLDPLNIYKQNIILYKEELSKNTDLILTENNIRVIRDFEVREKPYLPKRSISLGTFGSIGIVLGFLIAYIKAAIKK